MVNFDKLIDSHLAREFKPKSEGRYYPSEVGGCLRKTWYSYKDPQPTETDLLRIFEAGNILHSFIEDVIKSEKNPDIELLDSELPIKIEEKDFLISGRIDNLVLLKLEDKKVLVEVKSCKFLPDKHKKEHEMQLQLYMKATGVHDGLILYVQKDNLQTKEFEIRYDEEKADKILKRFDLLHTSLKSGLIPSAEARHNQDMKWLCDRCPWKPECWSRND